MTAVIEARGLRKAFGGKTVLKGVDLTLQPGRIMGLIGPNGAGKTTLLKGILGLASVEGHLEVLGLNPRKQRTRLMESVSFIADTAILPRWLKVSEALTYLEGVHPRFDRARAEGFLANTNIARQSRVGELSKGMMTQLHLALIMAIDSRLLVLDEPTLGLDILYRKRFYTSLLNDYFDEDKTILITTHQVEEIEHLLTDVVFIGDGEIRLNRSMADIEQTFVELSVGRERLEEALALGPMHRRARLGGEVLLYKDVAAERLAPLGDVGKPSLADLFVAHLDDSGVKPLLGEEVMS